MNNAIKTVLMPIHHKQFIYKEDFLLENGKSLPGFELAYTTIGQLNKNKDNVIWICHALTANSNPLEWWKDLFDAEYGIDINKYFVVCANVIGSCYGSTNPTSLNHQSSTAFGLSFPLITIRDMVRGLDLLSTHLQINKIELLIGGSMGGMQAMEWAIYRPEFIANLVLLATSAKHSAWGVAFNEAQRMAIEADPSFIENKPNAGKKGLEAARAIALLSYRNYQTYQLTQYDEEDRIDQFKASSYQQYQGQKLANRFDAKCYWYLSKAMDNHDVGRGRGSCKKALECIKANTLVIGLTTDLLFPIVEQQYLSECIPNATFERITSIYGHDGFLIETQTIKQLLQKHFTL